MGGAAEGDLRLSQPAQTLAVAVCLPPSAMLPPPPPGRMPQSRYVEQNRAPACMYVAAYLLGTRRGDDFPHAVERSGTCLRPCGRVERVCRRGLQEQRAC